MICFRNFLILLSLTTLTSVAASAEDVAFEYRGYVESVFNSYAVNSDSKANPGNRLGLAADDSSLIIDFSFAAENGPFRLFVETYARASDEFQDQTAKPFQQYLSMTNEDQDWFFRVGKVVPNWGVGQIWNPVRALSNEGRKDLIFPNRAIEGVWLTQAQHILDAESSITFLYFPMLGDTSDAGVALRYSSALDEFDYAISAYGNSSGTRRAGLEMSWLLGPASVVSELTFSDFSEAEFIDSDGSLSARGNDQSVSFLLGSSVALPQELQLTVEYFHNSDGFSKKEFDTFTNFLPANLSLYNALGNGKDSFYAGLSRRFIKNASTLGFSTFYNVQSDVSLLRIYADTQLTDQLGASLAISRYLEPCCRSSVNLYNSTVDARLRWNF
jgi:hypothetical protein